MPGRRGRFALVTLVLAGCGGGGGGGDGGGGGSGGGSGATGSVSGRVIFQRPLKGPFLEAEPNDSVDRAHDLGSLAAGDVVTVFGSADASTDPFDGFRFRAPARTRLTVTLRFDDSVGNDLGLSLHDPISMQFLESWDDGSSPQTGGFHAKGSFDLVVRAASGRSPYEIHLQAEFPSSTIAEREPNGAPEEAQSLGEAVPGDSLVLGGSLDSVSDPVDGFLLACPAEVRVVASLTMPAFSNYDLEFLDATGDLESPSPLATFASSSVPESGAVVVGAGTLLLVRARAAVDDGPYVLSLSASPPPPAVVVPRAAMIARASRPSRPGAADSGWGEPIDSFATGEALLVVEPGREDEEEARVRERGGRIVERSPSGYTRVEFPVPPVGGDRDAARFTLSRVAGLPGGCVRHAEPNRRRFALQEPDDPLYAVQWHYRMIRLPEAWDVTTGSVSTIVAVIDTGGLGHLDLAGRQIAGYDFISDPSMAADGDGRDPDPTDVGDGVSGRPSSFHGSHVAGTIGAATNNGEGVAGVDWACKIMHLRVLGRNGGTDADIAEAVRYAARLPNASGTLPPARAHVINLSLGWYVSTEVMRSAVSAARAAGVVIFAAAGNDSLAYPHYPSSYPGVVSVVALNSARGLAWYSNRGPGVDLAAPGGDYVDRDADGHFDLVMSIAVDGYRGANGTSMACPHAAGVAALLLSIDPTLTPDEIEAILVSTAEDLGPPGRDDTFGHGLVDALAAVRALVPVPPQPPGLWLFPTHVTLSDGVPTADVTIGNVGGGLVTVGPVSAETRSGGDWLSASLLGPGDERRSAKAVRIALDRAGLLPGVYGGRVTVESDGGTKHVDVVANVAAILPPPPSVDVRVRAIRADTGVLVQEIVVNPTLGLVWEFSSLPAGPYHFLASSDLDGDGVLCEDGDWCGAYPLASDPEPVVVHASGEVTGIDFSVVPQRVLGATAR